MSRHPVAHRAVTAVLLPGAVVLLAACGTDRAPGRSESGPAATTVAPTAAPAQTPAPAAAPGAAAVACAAGQPGCRPAEDADTALALADPPACPADDACTRAQASLRVAQAQFRDRRDTSGGPSSVAASPELLRARWEFERVRADALDRQVTGARADLASEQASHTSDRTLWTLLGVLGMALVAVGSFLLGRRTAGGPSRGDGGARRAGPFPVDPRGPAGAPAPPAPPASVPTHPASRPPAAPTGTAHHFGGPFPVAAASPAPPAEGAEGRDDQSLPGALRHVAEQSPSPAITEQVERLLSGAPGRDELVRTAIRLREQLAPREPALADVLHRTLEEVDVRELVADGERFDPARHEALGTVPTLDPAQHDVMAETARCGYLDRGRMLRPPQVVLFRLGEPGAAVPGGTAGGGSR